MEVQRNNIDDIPGSKSVPATENQQTAVQRNNIDESPSSKAIPTAEIQQQKAAAVKQDETYETVVYTKAQRPAPYWSSMMGEQRVYVIPGSYQGGAYYAAVPTLWPRPRPPLPVLAKVNVGVEATRFTVAYNSSGRAVYCTGSLPP